MRKVVSLALAVLFLGYASAFAGGSGNCIEPLKTTTDRYAIGAAFGYNIEGRFIGETAVTTGATIKF